ncbi:MAG TPA: bifunctional precorrin-2 dehydrogenase/sirohydrochlorin ferrochelatase [Terriglobales bacterium]|jgi:precorrin-2 dehydrogenase/sirohydrochlorin ferrochelatase|nr:bifunctional precorrin-2 dehydrogenase/sirohydrochlorin ferrochelatase [Terriglobales bacterium]
MSLFPIFLKLDGRRCLVVGAGKVGEPKIESLLAAHAEVIVVAPQATATVEARAGTGGITWHRRAFDHSDLDGAVLVIAATSSVAVNETVFVEAQRRGILCNSVDDPEHCDFFYPAVVRRGDFQVAISTGGNSPALAQRLRTELEKQFGPEYAEWVSELGRAREQLFTSDINSEERRQKLHELASRETFQAAQLSERICERTEA